MIKLEIPIKPLSINAAWKGRRFKTAQYKQYEIDLSWFLKGRKIEGEVEIHYRFYLQNYAMTDASNLIKLLEDSIVKAGLIIDDRKVKRFTCEKFKSEDDKIEIIISKYE